MVITLTVLPPAEVLPMLDANREIASYFSLILLTKYIICAIFILRI